MRKFYSLSIRARLTLWYGAILALTFCAISVLVLLALRHSVRVTVDKDLRDRLGAVRSYVDQEATHASTSQMKEELNEDAIANAGPAYLRIVGRDESFLYQSPSTRDWPLSIAIPRDLPTRGLFRTIYVRSKPVRVLSAPVAVGTVQIGLPLEEFDEIQQGFIWWVVLGTPVLLFFACMGGYWMSGRALRPVDQIAGAAGKITAGNLSDRLPIRPNGDELDRLSQVLNNMLAGLESAFKRVTQFTADASHELRTPLAIIRTTAEVTRARPRSAEEQERAWASVLAQTERATQLVDDLLTLARGDSHSASLPFETVDLSALTRAACSEMQVVADVKGLKLTVAAAAQMFVTGDGEALRRTVTILLDNAVKATAPGGHISVSLSFADRQTDWMVLVVTDDGCGISPQDLPHIFDRFYRVSRDRSRDSGGAGLGLAIAQWIVTEHGGFIEAESKLGSGSTFRVRLPGIARIDFSSEILQNRSAT
ncbi:MAG TPA: ATP-binding protein [Bryobacteraceae bacterium]|nr:ATP-binding protein [Bryobacteraceae bacterium]